MWLQQHGAERDSGVKFHPLAALFPLMQGREFDELVADIKANGLLEPIWLHGGQILDGRNRWRACEAAGIKDPPTRVYDGDDPLIFVLSMNLRRRHLTEAQKAVLALDILPQLEERARRRMLATQNNRSAKEIIPEQGSGQARDQAAAAVGVNARYVQSVKRIAREAPHLIEPMRAGALSVPQALLKLTAYNAKRNLQRPVAVDLHFGIHRGDFRQLSNQIADDSVELVFTDPPYDGESLPLYEDAARVAARILKPGGSFITYSGQSHLPEVIQGCLKHLRYWWIAAGLDPGSKQQMPNHGVIVRWKPLLWFVKGTRGNAQTFVHDVVDGSREKDHHKWQQAESVASHFIEKLTSPHGLVVDFFLGGGTTAAAAEKLGRPWIGFEIDAAAAESASRRLDCLSSVTDAHEAATAARRLTAQQQHEIAQALAHARSARVAQPDA
jgi:hypothetical protein